MMVSHITKRTLALVLALVMIFSVLPMMSWAAAVNTGVSGLSADSSGSATWTGGNAAVTGSVKASSSTGCGGTSYSAQTGTLTYTNNSGSTALLSFDFTVVTNGGAVKIDGSSITAGGSYSKKLDAGGTAAVEITSNASNDNSTQIEMTNLKLTPELEVTVTFKAPENGSYTVDGAAITADTPITKLTTDSFALDATAASGYKFFGWYSETEEEYFATNASVTRSFTSSQTVYPVFVGSSSPVFQVGSKLFFDLNDAIGFSQSSGTAKITLISNGTLPAGNYTIPNGKTLLIPFDEAQTVYTSTPGMTTKDDGTPAAHVTPSAFRTLTMESGANIVVASGGVLCVASQLSAVGTNSGSWNATPTGPHGRIAMNSGSSIDVQSGGKLYSWGYIAGSGNVYARSGAEVWECFQIRSWRGGTCISSMAGNGQKVFPLNQYYVQNIEAPLTIYAGATEKVFAAVNASSQQFGASATFVGSNGMFVVSNGSVTKRYIGAADRLELSVNGDFSISQMSLRITGLPVVGTLDLNTADYVLPINSNITIKVNSGTTKMNQDVAFFPGTELIVENGANVTIASGHKAYVYDKDQWGEYAAAGLQLVVVGYSTVNGTTAKRNTNSLVDAKLDINGTMKIEGQLYTTESGAAIVSSAGTGKVLMQANPGTDSNTYQATVSGSSPTYVSIPITAAKLQNADGSYVETADKSAGTEIRYVNGEWGGEAPPLEDGYYLIGSRNDWNLETLDSTVKFELNTASNENEYQLITDLAEGEEFKVVKIENGSAVWYPDGSNNNYVVDTAHAGAGKTVYFRPNGNGGDDWHYHVIYVPAAVFTVTFLNYDGTELASYALPYGSMPVYDGPIPEKPADLQFSYSFKEWTPELAEVTADATYTAVFEGVLNQYTIRFLNYDGTVLQSGPVDYGTRPVYEGEIPEKPADAQFSYSFNGWEPEITEVVGDADYTAVFSSSVQTYTVVWKNWNGMVLETDEGVPYGEMPSYDGQEPTKPADDENVYSFFGWDPEISPVTGDIEYTAIFEADTRFYRITWIVDGVETQSEWAYDEMPYFDGTPEKAPDAQFSYTFDHWEPEIAPVTGDAVYTAVFNATLNKYLISFLNEDGSELWSGEFEYGTIPVYGGEIPVKESSDAFHYVFAGWEPALHEVTGEEAYFATFTEERNTFTVTWLNYDGTLLEEDTEVPYGDMPSYDGEEPEKPEDAQFSYSFVGWTPSPEPVTGNVTYVAVFESNVRQYVIRFVDDDGTVLMTYSLDYGAMPVYDGEIPEKAPTAEYSYSFIGWEPQITEVTEDATYTAVYDTDINQYAITFLNWNGELLQDGLVPYGEMPAYVGVTPTRAGDAQFSYEFIGWEPALSEVTEDAVYVAVFEQIVNKYNVVYLNYDLTTVLQSYEVEYGAEVPAYVFTGPEGEDLTPVKPADAQYSYVFSGWDPELTEGETVTGDMTFVARFTGELNSYEITWIAGDDTYVEHYLFGQTPSFSHDTPTKASTEQYNYVFVGWDKEILPVTCDETYTALFEEELKLYYVSFMDEDGITVLKDAVAYPYGTPANEIEQPPAPTKPADEMFTYSFAGWYPELAEVTEDVTYFATYDAEIILHSLCFDPNGAEGDSFSVEVAHGDSFEAPACPFDRPYYEFQCWNTEPDGSGSSYQYPEMIPVYSDMTLYAIWSPVDGWREIDGNYYYYVDDEPVTGEQRVPYPPEELLPGYGPDPEDAEVNVPGNPGNPDNYDYPDSESAIFIFNEEGVFQRDLHGKYDDTGVIRWIENGMVVWHAGLVFDGNDFYYFKRSGMVANVETYVAKTNALLPAAKYLFDGEGRLMQLEGIHEDLNGNLCYFVNFTKNYAGLVEWEGDYYYIKSDLCAVRDATYYVIKTNDLLPVGYYEFNGDGRMVIKNGVQEENGELYYFENSIKVAKGLVEFEGAYYYFPSALKAVRNERHFVFEDKANGLMPEGYYWFDEDSKLFLNGLNEEDGKLYYYENGLRTYAGLIEIDGDLYYVKSDCTAIRGQSYYVAKTNGLIPAGSYAFDADGRLITKNGIYQEGEYLFYYIDNVRQIGLGLVQLEDETGSFYIYVRSGGDLAVGAYSITKTNGLLPAGSYDFGTDGKLYVE